MCTMASTVSSTRSGGTCKAISRWKTTLTGLRLRLRLRPRLPNSLLPCGVTHAAPLYLLPAGLPGAPVLVLAVAPLVREARAGAVGLPLASLLLPLGMCV